ncbi:MAG: hypothetical protein Q8N05_08885 [Bacteroidota bacterium]|nr:hypothetical protein [Bacteroidota bacterium]
MKHLINQYSRFFGEMLHLEKIFPNSLFRKNQESHLTHQHFFSGKSGSTQKPTENFILLAFFYLINPKQSI